MNLYESIKTNLKESVPPDWSSDCGSYDGNEKYSPNDPSEWSEYKNELIDRAEQISIDNADVKTGKGLLEYLIDELRNVDDNYYLDDWDDDLFSEIEDITIDFDNNGYYYVEEWDDKIDNIDDLKIFLSDNYIDKLKSKYISKKEDEEEPTYEPEYPYE